MPEPTDSTEPSRDCPACARLVAFREKNRGAEPGWHNAPVASFGASSARLLIVGLAPGLRGANRTGRPFTGDYAGELLYGTLIEHGFARGSYRADPADGLALVDCRITNAVRCVPPENKPLPAEINTCRDFLVATLKEMPSLRAIVTLGRGILARRHRGGRPAHGFRELSLLALQHQYRRADAEDVSRRVRGGAALYRVVKPTQP